MIISRLSSTFALMRVDCGCGHSYFLPPRTNGFHLQGRRDSQFAPRNDQEMIRGGANKICTTQIWIVVSLFLWIIIIIRMPLLSLFNLLLLDRAQVNLFLLQLGRPAYSTAGEF